MPAAEALPLVLVHGAFGYGEEVPLFGLAPDYFPLAHIRAAWKGPLVAVDLGVASSDHDRACELFAQLLGLPTDYGEAHAARCGHERFGPDFGGCGRLCSWSADQPVHLVGHSFGGNTALTLLNLLTDDFWKRGTNEKWIHSITTICSPMHGCSIPYALGLPDNGPLQLKPWSLVRLSSLLVGPLFFAQLHFPDVAIWRRTYAFRMRQWRKNSSFSDVLSLTSGRWQYWLSGDNMLSESSPICCRERLCNCLAHLASLRLVAVVADSVPPAPLPTHRALRRAVFGCLAMALALTLALRRSIARLRQGRLRVRRRLLRLLPYTPAAAAAATLSGAISAGAVALSGKRSVLLRAFHGALYASCVRPSLQCTSRLIRAAASRLTSKSGLLVGGGEACANDGVVDLWSQSALDVPQYYAPKRGSLVKSLRTHGSSAQVHNLQKPLALSRTYSDSLGNGTGTEDDETCRPLEPGKWRVLRIAGSDHSLGTTCSPQSVPMFATLLELLRRS